MTQFFVFFASSFSFIYSLLRFCKTSAITLFQVFFALHFVFLCMLLSPPYPHCLSLLFDSHSKPFPKPLFLYTPLSRLNLKFFSYFISFCFTFTPLRYLIFTACMFLFCCFAFLMLVYPVNMVTFFSL